MNIEKPKFVYVTLIKTTPEKLWTALTDPEFMRHYWCGVQLESDWKTGSQWKMRRDDGSITDEGTVIKSEPPRLLSYSFHHLHVDSKHEKPSRVTFDIEPLGNKSDLQGPAVKLTVTHDEFQQDSTVYPKISGGWPVILSGLKTLLETGHSLELTKKSCQ